jgi:hypothetical protein
MKTNNNLKPSFSNIAQPKQYNTKINTNNMLNLHNQGNGSSRITQQPANNSKPSLA